MKPCVTKKEVIDRGKRNKAMNEVQLVENISFLEISPMQMEVVLLDKLQDHPYERYNLFRLKEDNLSQRNDQN